MSPAMRPAWRRRQVRQHVSRVFHGSVTFQFGEDANEVPNVLPFTPGWNYLVRPHRPRKEVLDGIWNFPPAQPVK